MRLGSSPQTNEYIRAYAQSARLFRAIEKAFHDADVEYTAVRLPLREAYNGGIGTRDPVIIVGSRLGQSY